MGTKFGNIHVKTNDLEEILKALEEIASARGINTAAVEELSGYESLIHQANLLKNIFYIGELESGWISILNDCFGWGEVESFGEVLS
ncbi:MAG: hypothetical protein K0S39_5326, partial [Paenibacillus sp.]|nr:hypothetical protein [Paenibacillus sp.]